jgi:hypothetical protein
MASPAAYPLRVEADLEPGLSRWLWLVKWVLAVPHYLIVGILVGGGSWVAWNFDRGDWTLGGNRLRSSWPSIRAPSLWVSANILTDQVDPGSWNSCRHCVEGRRFRSVEGPDRHLLFAPTSTGG